MVRRMQCGRADPDKWEPASSELALLAKQQYVIPPAATPRSVRVAGLRGAGSIGRRMRRQGAVPYLLAALRRRSRCPTDAQNYWPFDLGAGDATRIREGSEVPVHPGYRVV
jgi:hypothetical protein